MLPLADVRAVEFCRALAEPYCGYLFADMGADVSDVMTEAIGLHPGRRAI